MVVGTGVIILRIYGCRSLKEKRKIIKSLITKLNNRYKISIAEVGSNDVYSRAEIGFAMAGNDRRFINSVIDKMIDSVDLSESTEILDTDVEIFNF